jgi:hypothetical protein
MEIIFWHHEKIKPFCNKASRLSDTCWIHGSISDRKSSHFNPLNAELNPICHLLALTGVHHILHVSRIRVKLII